MTFNEFKGWLEDNLVYIVPTVHTNWEPHEAVELSDYDGNKVRAWFAEADWTITGDMPPKEIESFSFSVGVIVGAAAAMDLTVEQMFDEYEVDLSLDYYEPHCQLERMLGRHTLAK